jgi:hypothetical protein
MTPPSSDRSPAKIRPLQGVIGRLALLLFGVGSLQRLGVKGRTIALSIGCTMLLVFVANFFLIWDLRSSYQSARLTEVAGATDAADAVERLSRAGYLDAKLQPWAKEQLSYQPGRRPAHEQVLDLFDGVNSSAEGRARRAKVLEDVATGQLSAFPSRFFWVSSTMPTGSELFDRLADADGKTWRKELVTGDQPEEKKKFITAYLNAFLAKLQPPMRELNRFNGGVKWLAIFGTFVILWVVLARLYLLVRVQSYWLGSAPGARGPGGRAWYWLLGNLPPPTPDEHAELLALHAEARQYLDHGTASELVRGRMKDLGRSAESGVYGTLSYAVGLLPSLGFIGTVWGLGGALLQANGLFSVSDRQKTIGYITHELGIAFDTTLIALVASVISGLCIAALRLRERWLLAQVERELLREPPQPPALPSARKPARADEANGELTKSNPPAPVESGPLVVAERIAEVDA